MPTTPYGRRARVLLPVRGKVTMPTEIYEAMETLIGEFFNGDHYDERLKYIRGKAEDCADKAGYAEAYLQLADELEAAANLYEEWRVA